MHIVYIPSLGGYQVRTSSGGPGGTRFVAVRKAGGHAAALRRVQRAADELEQLFPRESRRGKISSRNRSGVPGVAIAWRDGADYSYPHVVGNWTDALGRQRKFSYSIDRHGLEGAVRLALERRKAGGAPVPTIAEAMRRLRAAYPEAKW